MSRASGLLWDFRAVVTREFRWPGLLAVLSLVLSGCGSGDESPAVTPTPPLSPTGLVIIGTVTKGPVDTADVELVPVDAFGVESGPAVATAVTDADGNFQATIPAGTGDLLVRTSGGSYVDEADREPDPALKRRISLSAAEGLESYLPEGDTTVTISLATQALLDKTRREVQAGTFAQQFAANRALASAAFGFDLISTTPANPVDPDPAASETERQYALVLGGLANLVNRIAVEAGLAAPTFEAIQAVAADFSDGRIDGLEDGTAVMVGGNAIAAFSLNEEITRFRNNNFDAYAGTTLVVVDEDVFSQFGVPVNAIPVAVADAFTVGNGATLTIVAPGVLTNDSDADDNPLFAELVDGPVSASAFTLGADGSFNYTHDDSGPGQDSFTYFAKDGLVGSPPVTVTIDIINNRPVAAADSANVAEGGTLNAPSVLGNDTDADNDTLTATLIDPPVNGTLTLNSDGTYTYVHDGSETATDEFDYVANDGFEDSLPATVTLTIIPVDDPPVANDDSLTVDEGGSASVLDSGANSVTDNDFDAEGAALTAAIADPPANGQLFLSGDGTFTYTHDGSETDGDSFTYTVSDGASTSAPALVTITVNPVNDPAVANADSLTVDEGGTQTLLDSGNASVLSNDTDAENDPLTAAVVSAPQNGQLTLNPDGTFSYAHDGSHIATDTFTYVANDGMVDSTPATVDIAVTLANDPPTTSGIAKVSVDENAADVVIDLLTVFDDEEDQPDPGLIYSVDGNTSPDLVSPTINDQARQLVLSFNTDQFGSADINVSATDSGGLSVTASFSVNVNGLPQAVADSGIGFSTSQDSTFTTGDVLLNDDLGDPVTTITAFDNPSLQGGVVASAGGGLFVYTPPATFTGLDEFNYTITDGNGDTSTATVTISVSASANQPPTDIALSNASVDENQPPGTLVGNFSTTDLDTGDTHLYTLVPGAGDTDNSVFKVAGDQLLTAAQFDFEQTSTLSIRVRTDDQNGGTFDEVFTIAVNDVPEQVTWISTTDGNWSDPANWSPARVPLPGDTVLIDVAGADPTVTIQTGEQFDVLSVECRDRLLIQGFAGLNLTLDAQLGSSTIEGLALQPFASFGATGASVNVPAPETLDGAIVAVDGGGSLTITMDSQVPFTPVLTTVWAADGAGSVLQVPGLQQFDFGSTAAGPAADFFIQATNGGRVDLPELQSITVVNSQDGANRSVRIRASDPDSHVALPMLTSFQDSDLDGGLDGLSMLTAELGGVIEAPLMTLAFGVHITSDGSAAIDLSSIGLVLEGAMTLSSDTFGFLNLTDLTGSRVVAQNGAQVDFAAVTVFEDADVQAFGGSVVSFPVLNIYQMFFQRNPLAFWRAEGASSRLEFPQLTQVDIGSFDVPGTVTWEVEAFDGGVIVMNSATSLAVTNDPAGPDTRRIELRAGDPGSLIDLQSLGSLSDSDSDSCITEINGGVVNTPPGAQLDVLSGPCP